MKKRGLLFYYDHFEEIVLVVMFAFMVLVTFLQVFMRYVVNHSLVWTEEMGRYLFVWISWIGISIGERKGEHIKITMLTDRFPFKTAQILNIVSSLVVIVVVIITGYYGIVLMKMLSGIHAQWFSLDIGLAPVYLAIPFSCGLMIFRSIVSIGASVQNCLRDDPS
jgi:TRAP-type C4-dicarboxylate transport system permease small subunit